MKRFSVTAGVLLASLFLAAPGARAQSGMARGKVLDEGGQPISDAKVEIEYKGGITRKLETKTNKRGEYMQVGLAGGMYRITASKEGFQSLYLDLRISIGDATSIPDIKLNSAAKAAAGGGAQPGEDLGAAFRKAADLARGGKLDEAEAAYKDMAQKHPTIPEVHYNLGYVYALKKDYAAAEPAYLKALELKPDYSEAVVGLARVYQDTNQTDKAMDLMTKAAASGAGDAKVQFNLGVFLLNASKSEEATAAFLKAESMDASNPEIQYHLGTLAVGQNKIPDAIARLEKYLSMSPTNQQNVATAQQLLAALKPKK